MIFARTASPRRNIELALWIRYQEKETEVPVEPAGVKTVFYCGVIEPTERRRKRSQIVDGTGSSYGTSHDATVECLTWFSIKLTTLRHKSRCRFTIPNVFFSSFFNDEWLQSCRLTR